MTASSSHDPILIVPSAPEYVAQMEDLMHASYGTSREHPDEVFTEAMFRHHRAIFPEGQFVALDGKWVIGQTVSMRIRFDLTHPILEPWWVTVGEGWLRHVPDGEWMYGVESVVHPSYRSQGVGGKLMEARFDTARALNLRGVVAGSAIISYSHYADQVSPAEYVQGVVEGRFFDGNLSKQIKKGFRPGALIEGYLPDMDSLGWGVSILWENPDHDPAQPILRHAPLRRYEIQRRSPASP
ncbi:MAG: GNAT family N-acetyltransferase [Anaerolineae bacterium]|nr:GNAT family N-acetyltransferase [Anaerolineae bacterium]NUQ03818.1 GNAT family N-acetyltransferase [Anaerolineae bacterium]